MRKAGSTQWVSDTFVATANPELCMPSSRATSNVIYAGTKPTTVTLKQPCALDISRYVYLATNDVDMKVPSRVLVAAGKANVGVPVYVADGTRATSTLISSQLSVGPYPGGWAHHIDLEAHPGLESADLDAWADENGARTVRAHVDLGFPAITDTVVRVESSDPLIPLPPTMTVAKGTTRADIDQSITAPEEDTEVRITATFGSQQRIDTVLVQRSFRPGDPIALSRQTFYGGGRAGFSINVERPAGPDGVPVTVSSDSSLLTFEPTTFRPGHTVASVPVDVAEVTESTPVTLHVTAGTHTYDVPITLQPGLAAITLPDRATSDEPFTGTVTLTGVAAVDTPVRLISGSSSFQVPSGVIIPAGETSATFQGVVHLPSSSTGAVTRLDAYLGRLYTSNDMMVTPAP
ncbi:putative serine/arginine repetitive matrix protein 1 [Nocardioidaceae bacterium Broad-1]|nr:putative serine/arginine repetitive matrix protein 1 [Nocardioidaceae bacterium Broad-1]